MTAQSLFGTVCFSVATAFASAVGGWLYRDLGYAALFGASSIVAVLGGLGFLLSPRAGQILPGQSAAIE